MKYCTKCAMPDSRFHLNALDPISNFDNEGVCLACRNYENREYVDWPSRQAELQGLCDQYRRDDGYYDCLIPVSGGKDSHYMVYKMKIEMGMNPLLVTVADPFTKTQAGIDNLRNLSETFGVDHFVFNMSIDLFREVTRIGFEEMLNPLLFIETAIKTVPLKMALRYKIPFIVDGEDGEYEYGSSDKWNSDALPWTMRLFYNEAINIDFWKNHGIPIEKLNVLVPPSNDELKEVDLKAIFMSYYEPWSSVSNLEVAERYGFRNLAHEWKREGCVEDFEQIDCYGYIVHLWLKYPKFGYQRTSDIVSRRVREGLLGLSEAKRLIALYDHKLDRKALDDFISFLGYKHKQFWDVVEKFWNVNIFERVGYAWRLKEPVYKESVIDKSIRPY